MRGTVLMLAGAALIFAQGAAAPVRYPLAPGTLTGSVNPYRVKPGDRIGHLAPFFGVHPIRIRKPSAEVLQGGLKAGQTIFIDQRHVMPGFQPWVSGIVLNVPEAHVYLVDKGTIVKSYPVAVSRSDWQVPIGQTRVVDKTKHPTWYVPPSIQEEMRENGEAVKTIVPPGPDNPLGTRWIGFYNGGFGFHGTKVPTSIKTYASHGCVRFHRAAIEDLYDRVKVGTPVRVYYQPVTMAIADGAVWLSCYPDIYGRGFDYRGAIRALAAQARVTDMLDPKAVEEAVRSRDGIPRNILRTPV